MPKKSLSTSALKYGHKHIRIYVNHVQRCSGVLMVTSNKHYQEKMLRPRRKTITSNGIFWKYWYCLTAGNLKPVFFQQYLLVYLESNSVTIPKITKQTTAWEHAFSTQRQVSLYQSTSNQLSPSVYLGYFYLALAIMHAKICIVLPQLWLIIYCWSPQQNYLSNKMSRQWNSRIWQWNSKI